jgi:hypothetical protein
MKMYGLIALMFVAMFASTLEAREGVFARWRAVRFGGSSGSVSGGSSGYSIQAPVSYGSTGGSSGTVVQVVPQQVVPMSVMIYESSPEKVLPRVLPKVREAICNGPQCFK